jgi:hypothetical protein
MIVKLSAAAAILLLLLLLLTTTTIIIIIIIIIIIMYAIPILTYSFGIISWSNTDLESLE